MKGTKIAAGLAAGVLAIGIALPGCAPQTKSGQPEAGAAETQQQEKQAPAQAEQKVELHRGYAAAHGDSAFTQIVVAVAEDGTILAANVDEYQYMGASPDVVPVPNSDGAFGEAYAEGKVLASKTASNDAYSAMMMEKGGATQTWLDSIKAIEESVVGKTIDELAGLDAVSGATLGGAPDYVKAIAEVAKGGDVVSEGTYQADGAPVALGVVLAAPHGDKSFASAATLVQGDTIIAVSIDEFQYMDAATEGLTPVPNSDAGFGEGAVAGKVLVSKSVNTDAYSAHMAEAAGSTTPWLASIEAIEDALAGTSIDDAAAIDGPDAVSGATLVDTAGYVQSAIEAANAA